jgi:hypothetical protein
MGESARVVTTADGTDDVRMLLYGLHLRGITARSIRSTLPGPDRWAIVVEPADYERAKASIGLVWEGIFETPSAKSPDGQCGFCGYSLLGVPDHPGQALACPECGINLRSHEARRAFREGRRPTTR